MCRPGSGGDDGTIISDLARRPEVPHVQADRDQHRSSSGQRRTDIAWLRILAVLLLFPFHTARVFDVWDEFYVKNDQLSTALTYFIAFMEPWHMPLLFLLAGAASWFALGAPQRRPLRGRARQAPARPVRLRPAGADPAAVLPGPAEPRRQRPGVLPVAARVLPPQRGGPRRLLPRRAHLGPPVVHRAPVAVLAAGAPADALPAPREPGGALVDLLARAATVPGVILLFAVALVPAMAVPEIAGGDPVFYLGRLPARLPDDGRRTLREGHRRAPAGRAAPRPGRVSWWSPTSR